ncbi:UbiA prenyltransferase family protein [Hymenobacter qilianensis]|uniref:hypothetical protein n=1 Tax=Hymenobacter qilianensis TaxID=1385715 RepID=UPI00293BA602|nr:hypothetical protein [Hymenobacter qilianensis]
MPAAVGEYWYLALLPIVYIAAITAISRGEVHGGDKKILLGSVGLYSLVIGSILLLMTLPQINGVYTIPFLVLFCYLIFPPLFKAISSLKPLDVRLAVKAGIMALILLDATIAAGFAGWWYGLIVLALFPLSRLLARVFAVT